MHIFLKAVIIIMCDFFQVIKNAFFLLCKFFAAISVASSVQIYFQIFYGTAPNKIVIKLTKLKKTNC